jgi:hypothetical protein
MLHPISHPAQDLITPLCILTDANSSIAAADETQLIEYASEGYAECLTSPALPRAMVDCYWRPLRHSSHEFGCKTCTFLVCGASPSTIADATFHSGQECALWDLFVVGVAVRKP